jgi:hypothetical protein
MKYEQLRFKEALIIKYTNGEAKGSMCLKEITQVLKKLEMKLFQL